MEEAKPFCFTNLPTKMQGGVVTAIGLMFAWLILGRLIDLLLELLWLVWVGLTVSATCYLPTVWISKHTKRVKLQRVLSKTLRLGHYSANELFAEITGTEVDGPSCSISIEEANINDDNHGDKITEITTTQPANNALNNVQDVARVEESRSYIKEKGS